MTLRSFRDLTATEAAAFYSCISGPGCRHSLEDQSIADKVFDMAVNMGMGTAVRLVRAALNGALGARLKLDGIAGPKTLAAINGAEPWALLLELRAFSLAHYPRHRGAGRFEG